MTNEIILFAIQTDELHPFSLLVSEDLI